MAFFGIFFFASAMIVFVTIFIVINVIRNFSKSAFGTPDITKVIEQQDTLEQTTPKSLSGMDAVYLPQIMEDFPDFNPSYAKSKVKAKLRETLKNKSELAIHNVVIAGYDRGSVEKTIRYQAALQYKENGRTVQKRYNLSYSFLLPTGDGATIAANCPNCGGAIASSTQKVCEYCDSRIVNVMGNTWDFTEVYES